MHLRTGTSLVLVGTALLGACSDYVSAPPESPASVDAAVRIGERLVGIRIDSGPKLVRPGAKLRLRSTMLFSQGGTFDGAYYGQWTSLHPEIAKVATNTGIVTGIVLGTASMVVSYANKADTVMVTVGTSEVAPLTVSPATAHLTVSDTVRVATSLDVPRNGTRNPSAAPLEWESSDPKVVTVSSTGLLTAKGPGRATVVVGSGSQAARVAVTVVAQELPPPATNPSTPGRPGIPGASQPELPRIRLDTRYVAPSGKTIVVREGGDLQKALDAAAPGDVIALESGATFTGNFTLPRKSGSGWITIRSDVPDSRLPREGERITPEYSSALAKIVAPNNMAALRTQARASHYRIMAVEITAAPTVRSHNGLVNLGEGGSKQSSLDVVPSYLIIDRAYIHGHPTLHLKRCVALQSASSAVIGSYLSECHTKGQDSQAIIGWNGPGPFKIVNNYLEGAGENVMFGGADPSIPGLIPSDIEIRQNHFYKPLAWRGVWSVKNLFELKSARRVLIEGNVFENSWLDAQTGFAILLKGVNQGGRCSWCETRDVTIRYNRITRAAGGVGMSSDKLRDVAIQDNVFEGLSEMPGARRLFTLMGREVNVIIDHNTSVSNVAPLVMDGGTKEAIRLTNNIMFNGRWGVPYKQLDRMAPGKVFSGNVIVGATSATLPPGNHARRALADVLPGYVSGTNALPQAASTVAGTDGRRVGADLRAIADAIRGVVLTPR
jgi:hypothetical protein